MANISQNSNFFAERYGAIQVASELGLLEAVSILLAIVAILMAIGGVFAFVNFRSLARRQATEEARKAATEIAEAAAIKMLEAELPKMVQEYSELAQHQVTAESADAIAQSSE